MLELDETLFVEHKSDLRRDSAYNVASCVASFANTLGGWLLLGVHQGKPVAEPGSWVDSSGPALVDVVRDRLRLEIDPLPAFEARVMRCPGRDGHLAARDHPEECDHLRPQPGRRRRGICGTPGFDQGALCVVSTDKREARSAFSNFGFNQERDVVAAPGGSLAPVCGEDVLSMVPIGTGRATACGYTADYDEYAGTSMATPHVAGVAAMLAAQGRSDEGTIAALETTARHPPADVRGAYEPTYGYGIVDAQAAVATPNAAKKQRRSRPR